MLSALLIASSYGHQPCCPYIHSPSSEGEYHSSDYGFRGNYSYLYGMGVPERSYQSANYRYGFNGMEKDDEMYDDPGAVPPKSGSGNSYDFGARMYNARVGRWMSQDPETRAYPDRSPYSFALDNPIKWKDADGGVVRDENGNIVYTVDSPNSQWIQMIVRVNDRAKGIFTVFAFNAERGRILTDKGSELYVFKATSSQVHERVVQLELDAKGNLVLGPDGQPIIKKSSDTGLLYPKVVDCSFNCTGNALTDQEFTISSHQITPDYLKEEGFEEIALSEAQEGDVGLYISDATGKTEHLELFLSPGAVTTKGGIAIDPGPQPPGRNPHFTNGNTFKVFRKQQSATQVIGPINSGGSAPTPAPNVVQTTIVSEKPNGTLNTVTQEEFLKIKKDVQKNQDGDDESND